MREKRENIEEFFSDFMKLLKDFAEMREDVMLQSIINAGINVLSNETSVKKKKYFFNFIGKHSK